MPVYTRVLSPRELLSKLRRSVNEYIQSRLSLISNSCKGATLTNHCPASFMCSLTVLSRNEKMFRLSVKTHPAETEPLVNTYSITRRPQLCAHMGTRNKIIRTCDNCRRRKIRCDRQVPACSACRQKSLICDYKARSTREEKKAAQKQDNGLTLLQSGMSNPLGYLSEGQENESNQSTFHSWNYVSKKGGRISFYGPTSFRTVICLTSVEAYFIPFWNSFKDARKKWKESHQHLSLGKTNSNLLHMPLCLITSGSILDALLTCLPNFDKILEVVKIFFESEFFLSLPFIDPTKVFQDLNTFLVEDFRIKSFNLKKKDNICKVAIVTEILSVVYFQDEVPATIELFHNVIISSLDGKSSFLEKVQFLILRYIIYKIEGTVEPDNASLRTLVSMAYMTATDIGLHRTENYYYFRDDPKYLSTLWTFILFADFEVSFSIGSPLGISEAAESILFFQKNPRSDTLQDPLPLFAYRVSFLREILVELYRHATEPGLETIIYKLKLFYIQTFGPISFDIVSERNSIKDFKVFILKLSTLQLISNISLINLSFRKELSYDLVQNTLLCQFLSLKVAIDNLKVCLDSAIISKKDFSKIRLFAVSYSFHSIAPRLITDLFSVIIRIALFEKSQCSVRQERHSNCSNITDFENILKEMDFSQRREVESVDSSTALDLLQTLHDYYLESATSEFIEISSRSYICKIADLLIPSIKTATTILLDGSEALESANQMDSVGNTECSPLFENLVDFFFDDDLLFQD